MFRWGWGCDRAGEADLAVLCCAVLYYRSEEIGYRRAGDLLDQHASLLEWRKQDLFK
jgi:hypothetical protein